MRCVTRQFDGENIKAAWLFISRYIELYEVCHPPVWWRKHKICVIIYFALHRTVWGVSPASLIEKTLKLRDYLFRVTSNCMRCTTRQFDGENIKYAWLFISRYIELYEVCHPPVLMGKTLNLCNYLFRVTSNCMRWATRQFDGENIKSALLFILRYIELYEVSHPPVLMDKTLKLRDYYFALH